MYCATLLLAARPFMLGFNLMKPFIAKHTLAKISIYGTDEDKWKPDLHNFLPNDSIPEKFGGCATLVHVYDIVYDGIMAKLKGEKIH